MTIITSKIKKPNYGFTLIESLIVIFIFSTIVVTFYSTWSLGTRQIIESKNRLMATSLVNQKMEIIRNLPYGNVGVAGGVPNGPIDPDESETMGGKSFHVLTDIRYKDDSFDGVLGGSPNDTIPNDYKTVRVVVKWGAEANTQQVFLVSNFVPPGREEAAGGGTLAINAADSGGQGVPSVSVRIVNSESGVNINTTTDDEGHLLLPGTPAASLNTYEITLSKDGYETVATLPPYPITSFHPAEVHTSVSEGGLTQKDMTIDALSDIKIFTVDPLGNPIANTEFNLTGGRVLGTDDETGDVFNYTQDLTADAGGEKNIEDVSPGNFSFALRGTSDTDYKFFKVDPGDDSVENKFAVSAGSLLELDAIIASKSIPSLIVTVKSDSGAKIENASINLVNLTQGYDVTRATDKYGKVFFPEAGLALENSNYDISVSADGFAGENGTVTISNLTEEEFSLTPS